MNASLSSNSICPLNIYLWLSTAIAAVHSIMAEDIGWAYIRWDNYEWLPLIIICTSSGGVLVFDDHSL